MPKKEPTNREGVPLHLLPRKENKPVKVTHEVRTKSGKTKVLSYGRKDAILMMCVECMGWETDPKECQSPLCPLYPFRGMTMATR